jgi:hypothetical protein
VLVFVARRDRKFLHRPALRSPLEFVVTAGTQRPIERREREVDIPVPML